MLQLISFEQSYIMKGINLMRSFLKKGINKYPII